MPDDGSRDEILALTATAGSGIAQRVPDDDDDATRADLAACVLSSSWLGTAAGCALAVPIGIRRKSMAPLLVFGIGGTLVDMGVGLVRCGGLSAVVGEARRRDK